MKGSVVALHQHFGHASGETKVAVNLEWRMRIEEVWINTFRKHVLDDFVSMVTIEQTCPQVDFPSGRPSCSFVATLDECCFNSLEQCRLAVRRNLIAGIQTISMRDVTMLVVGIVGILQPFLQLSVAAYLHRR